MLKKLSELWDKWSTIGVKLPYLFDPTTNQPSITLGMLYISSLIMFGSLIGLHIKDTLLSATITTIMVWIIAYVMYRLRKLDKFKIDLDDKEIELSNGDDSVEKEENES